jgi:uncharacterized protein
LGNPGAIELNPDAHVDTSQVEDARGSGGGGRLGLPLGGGGGGRGGIVGVIVGLIVLLAGGGYGANQILGGGGDGGSDNTAISQECGDNQADRAQQEDCQVALYVDSIQGFWTSEYPQAFGGTYQPVATHLFSGQVSTGCGAADAGMGPFYCPNDQKVYIDLSFYDELANRFGAKGQFAQAYVLAHEYGHHVQDLNGTMADVDRQQQRDPNNPNITVPLELQADCLAGVWAKHAATTKDSQGNLIFNKITDQDIQDAIDAAGSVGDDAIQRQAGQQVNPDTFTHGSSAQREKWTKTGYSTGDPKACNTFGG